MAHFFESRCIFTTSAHHELIAGELPHGSPYGIGPLSVLSCPVLSCLSVCLSVTLVYCDQTVGWLVGWGLTALLTQNRSYRACKFVNGWMDHDETSHGGRTRLRPYCVRWGPRPPKRDTAAPTFRPMSIVAKRLHGSRCKLAWK